MIPEKVSSGSREPHGANAPANEAGHGYPSVTSYPLSRATSALSSTIQRSSQGKWIGSRVAPSSVAQATPMSCWASALGIVSKKSDLELRLDSALDSSISGMDTQTSDSMAKQLGGTKTKDWYTAALGGHIPIAVGLPDHFIVVTALEVNNSQSRAFTVGYWDPADAKYREVSLADFNSLKPSIGYY